MQSLPKGLSDLGQLVSFSGSTLAADVVKQDYGRPSNQSFLSEADSSQTPTSSYLFVSNVRFFAMLSIVWVHTVLFFGNTTEKTTSAYFQVMLEQVGKFGTIAFFLISGFLLGDRLTGNDNRVGYLFRRGRAILVPWLFWGCAGFAVAFSCDLLGHDGATLTKSLHDAVRQYVEFVFLRSFYWFVPNFIVCLAIVLMLYRRVADYIQGPLFFAFGLFYGVNAYLNIIEPRHPAALFGFVFYVWLGSYAYRNSEALNGWLHRTSWIRLIMYTAVAGLAALAEYHLLRQRSSVDPNNTLRISNQLFSVLMVLLIVKCRRPLPPLWINVRTETFGIYLIHGLLLELAQMGRNRFSAEVMARIHASGIATIGLGLSFFVAVYLSSLAITKWIRSVPMLRWVVGR